MCIRVGLRQKIEALERSLLLVDAWAHRPLDASLDKNFPQARHEENLRQAIARVCVARGRDWPIRGFSSDVARRFADTSPDWVFLHALHLYEAGGVQKTAKRTSKHAANLLSTGRTVKSSTGVKTAPRNYFFACLHACFPCSCLVFILRLGTRRCAMVAR